MCGMELYMYKLSIHPAMPGLVYVKHSVSSYLALRMQTAEWLICQLLGWLCNLAIGYYTVIWLCIWPYIGYIASKA